MGTLLFGPLEVGKSHLAIGRVRKVVEQSDSVRYTTATALLANLGKAESEGNLGDKLTDLPSCALLLLPDDLY
ncbi:MAG: ATP-binding protein [Isosphaeraceae bacterium]